MSELIKRKQNGNTARKQSKSHCTLDGKNYANAYRDYVNNWLSVENWFSSFMPEDEEFSTIYAFCMLCLKFHELGF